MTAKIILTVSILAFSAAGYRFAQSSAAEPTAESLRARVNAYYATLKGQEFENTWTFLSAQMRRDTPRAEYVKTLKSAQRGVEVTKAPEVSIAKRIDSAKTPFTGHAVATLRVIGIDGKPVDVEQ